MKFLLFIAAYLIAFVPALLTAFAVCYAVCAAKLLYDCFGRPRATVHVVTHLGVALIVGTFAAATLRGMYFVGERLDYDPTVAIMLMFVFPGLTLYSMLPAHLREAERDVRGERSNWHGESAAIERENPVPARLSFLFAPLTFGRKKAVTPRAHSTRARRAAPVAPAPSAVVPPPVIAPAPEFSPEFRADLLRELEGSPVTGEADPLTAAIGMIKMGTNEIVGGWLVLFSRSTVYLVSATGRDPGAAFVFGSPDERNCFAVFTREELAERCRQEFPALQHTLGINGLELLRLARAADRGLWVNPLNPACSVKFPPAMMDRFLAVVSTPPLSDGAPR